MHIQTRYLVLGLLSLFILNFSAPAFGLNRTFDVFENAPMTTGSELGGSCSDVHLLENPNDPLHEIPIYDQGETALCYAYVVSQMAEYALRKNQDWQKELGLPEGEHFSAIWASSTYKNGKGLGIRIRKNSMGSGYFQTAYRDYNQAGVCKPKVYEKAIREFKGNSRLSDPDYFYLFEKFWALRENGNASPESVKLLLSQKDVQRIQNRVFPNNGSAQMEDELIRIRDQVNGVPNVWIDKKKKNQYIQKTALAACTEPDARIYPNLPKTRQMGLGWATRAKLKREIDSTLDSSDPEPIAIGYCSAIYSENDDRAGRAGKRRVLLPRIHRIFEIEKCVLHYSLIIGRQRSPETGKCQYLVRNTSGRDFWTSRYPCLCEKKDGSGYENCRYDKVRSPSSDRVVGCFIDEEPLLNSVYDLVFFDRG